MRAGSTIRRIADLGRALIMQRGLRAAERMSRDEVEALQAARLRELTQRARESSAFHRLNLPANGALADLPITTKETLMANFDAMVTDSRLQLRRIEEAVQNSEPNEYYLGDYRILLTSGSTGQRGVTLYNRREWSRSLALLMRRMSMAGVRPSFPRKRRVAVVGSAWPINSRLQWRNAVRNPLQSVSMVEFTRPMADIAADLERIRPQVLSADSNTLFVLAGEQAGGRLDIQPQVIWSSSEVLTEATRELALKVWGVIPFDTYATSETGVLGSPCTYQTGLHLYEDQFIFEVVDEQYRPVEAGVAGRKLLVTNLYNHTLPQIRYELSDHVTLSRDSCPCGRPFRLVSSISGREEEVIYLEGRDGIRVPVPPVHFRRLPRAVPGIRQAQVILEGDVLHLRLALSSAGTADEASVGAREYLGELFKRLGARDTPVEVEVVDEIERDPRSGKTLVVAARPGASASEARGTPEAPPF